MSTKLFNVLLVILLLSGCSHLASQQAKLNTELNAGLDKELNKEADTESDKALSADLQKNVINEEEIANVCQHYGPQTPRDIDQVKGTNDVSFPIAPDADEMNLCNIHFHNGAEHKAKAFSIEAHGSDDGHGGGYQCGISKDLTAAELKAYPDNQCAGIAPGDTIEVHWVHSSCDVTPGPGLGSCLSESCANPSLRVETQVFTVVNDSDALSFADFTKISESSDGYQQANALPKGTGSPIEFLGSTTGPKYTQEICSPMQVTWSVRPQCAKISIASLSAWCAQNEFNEDHAHGVRKLVTAPSLLSPIDN